MQFVRSGRNPFEALMLAACILSGSGGVLQPRTTSRVIAQLLPQWELYLWYGGLLVGGLVGMAGIARRRPSVFGFVAERVALVSLAFLSLAYAVAVVTSGGLTLAPAVAFVVAFAVACVVRVWQIWVDLRAAAERARAAQEATGGA